MNPFEMVLGIIIVVTIGKVLRARFQAAPVDTQAALGEATRLHEEIRQLRDRIAVLERVVTENHASLGLDREIERLRDR